MAELPDNAPTPALLIDGLFGIGLSRPLDASWQDLIARLNRLDCARLALDCPSGWTPTPGMPWRGDPRRPHADFPLPQAGSVRRPRRGFRRPGGTGGAGLPAALYPEAEGELNRPSARRSPVPATATRAATARCRSSAARPACWRGAARRAQRAGRRRRQGLPVRAGRQAAVDPAAPELMMRPADESADIPPPTCWPSARPGATGAGRAAAGTGDLPRLSAGAGRRRAQSACRPPRPGRPHRGARRATVLTPHPAEAARLLKLDTPEIQADRVGHARRLAALFNCVVVLKGAAA
ncbi:putative carbohydrate kinase [Chromobacterium violaceum]|uniref:Bifunctional NAD(P)H-hydrate repair enzyme Nnr n=1 Tax=Chromobacterium violaceum TaxID=536 RepID=A0A447THH1_CHRVL|nr:putative carbohydrate kinase [Chromobacterium violaceum]